MPEQKKTTPANQNENTNGNSNAQDGADPKKEEELAKKEQEDFSAKSMGSLISPEGVAMLTIAFFLDVLGWLLLIFLLDDLFILDIIGFLLIGGWMFFRSGHTPSKRIKQKGIGKKVGKRLGLSTLIEAIPYLGDIMPTWTIAVYYELKNNPN